MLPKLQTCGDSVRRCSWIPGDKTTASPTSYSFFKILVASSFSKFLHLPPSFCSRILDMKSQVTSLEDVNGKRWKVQISNLYGSLAFHHGWSKFVSDHALSYGELLIFTYMAGSHFLVKIYGTSALEKLTFSETRNRNSCDEQIVEVIDSDSDYDHVEMASTPENCSRGIAPRRKAVPAMEQKSYSTGKLRQSSNIKMKDKVSISMKKVSFSTSNMKVGFNHSYDPVAEELVNKEKQNSVKVADSGFSEVEMAGLQDVDHNINAREWINEVHDAPNIFFGVDMAEHKFGAEEGGNFPTFCNSPSDGKICDSRSLYSSQECVIEGKARSNLVLGNMSYDDVFEERTAAENFLEDFENNLVDVAIEFVNDVLIDLEVPETGCNVDNGQCTESMQIFPYNYGLQSSHREGNDLAILDNRIQPVPNAVEQMPLQWYRSAYKRDEDGRLSNLQLTVASSSKCFVLVNAHSSLELPLPFPLSLGKWWHRDAKKMVIFLRNSDGQLWPVMYHEEIKGSKFLNIGWSAFAAENDIREGDICAFERVEDTFKDIFQVHMS